MPISDLSGDEQAYPLLEAGKGELCPLCANNSHSRRSDDCPIADARKENPTGDCIIRIEGVRSPSHLSGTTTSTGKIRGSLHTADLLPRLGKVWIPFALGSLAQLLTLQNHLESRGEQG
jgi:hypothetical protein